MAFLDLLVAMHMQDCSLLEQLARGGMDMNCRDSMHSTVLHHAAGEYFWGKIQPFIRKLVELGALVDAKDRYGRTPLHYSLSISAAEKMEKKILGSQFFQNNKKGESNVGAMTEKLQMSAIELFVQLGADINSNYNYMVSSLERAILQKNTSAVKALVRLGVVNITRKTDARALNLAVMYKKKALIKRLVELGANVNWSRCHLQVAPIHKALDVGSLEIIKILVENGAAIDVHVRKIYDINLIHQVIFDKQYELVKDLVDLGVDLNAKFRCCSLVYEAVTTGKKDILEYFVSKGADTFLGMTTETALGEAVTTSNHDLAKILLDCGADVNVRFDECISPLVAAMRHGDIDVVNSLYRLCGHDIGDQSAHEIDLTVIRSALNCDARMLKLLFTHGGDVNLKYDCFVYPIHDAVVRGDEQMVRALAEHRANLNVMKTNGSDLLFHYLFVKYKAGETCDMKILEVLIGAGADVNASCGFRTSSLHEAVRLGNLSMIRTLGELKANMNPIREDTCRPIHLAVRYGDISVVRYLAQHGSDVDACCTTEVTPLHDAIRLGSVEMVQCLITSGASADVTKHDHQSLLHSAIASENNEMVKCLIECGVDINTKFSFGVNIFHDAVAYGRPEIITAVLASAPLALAWKFAAPGILADTEEVSLLDVSSSFNRITMTETILKSGIDRSCLQRIRATPYDVAVREGKLDCAFLMQQIGDEGVADTVGSVPLHTACKMGHIDIARLLIVTGGDLNRLSGEGKKPLDYLPRNFTSDGHVLQETLSAVNMTENVAAHFVSVAGCQSMTSVICTPGIGDIGCIGSQSPKEILPLVGNALRHVLDKKSEFPGSELVGIGSASEGTKVGIPDEMDFMFKISLGKNDEAELVDFGHGYAKCSYEVQAMTKSLKGIPYRVGSGGFHRYLLERALNQESFWSDISEYLRETSADRLTLRQRTVPLVKRIDRRACSEFPFRWDDGDARFPVSVDIVPCLHVNSWPQDAVTKTWLMSTKELRSRGYVLVPKPPHVNSDYAKNCTEDELETLWKISFPHLETEHMQRLEQRVKDVYLTAKCLRNPDVCRILIQDGDSLPRNVDKYITSYLLKMCFFKNVEEFRATDSGLEAMVCKVYEDLVTGLSQNFIPLFFLPNVSALGGIQLDAAKSAKVAEIMLRYVKALYQRDCGTDEESARLSREQAPSSVYKIYQI